jgi:hypothetical protein
MIMAAARSESLIRVDAQEGNIAPAMYGHGRGKSSH